MRSVQKIMSDFHYEKNDTEVLTTPGKPLDRVTVRLLPKKSGSLYAASRVHKISRSGVMRVVEANPELYQIATISKKKYRSIDDPWIIGE
jgi:hypothetical protein